jgi:MoaA/NifB/PqqE/SkfB family radical SAM enzyme
MDNIKRISISISNKCQNKCFYCNGYIANKLAKDKDVISYIIKGREYKLNSIEFTGGEPTLHPSLSFFIALSKMLGYKNITILTNARKLSNNDYINELIKSGLTSIIISFPSINSKIFSKITNSENASIIQSLKGIKNCLNKKIEIGIVIPVIKLNSKDLLNTIYFFDKLQISFITLSQPILGFPFGSPHVFQKCNLYSQNEFKYLIKKMSNKLKLIKTKILIENILLSNSDEYYISKFFKKEILDKYIYVDAIKNKYFVMPDIFYLNTIDKNKLNSDFKIAIDLQYGKSDFYCNFDFRKEKKYNLPYNLIPVSENKKIKLNYYILNKFLCFKNKDKSIDIWGRDKVDSFPKIKELLLLCKRKGFKKIRVWTTGLNLLNKNKLNRLVEYGVNELEIPIYGATSTTHDKITNCNNSFIKLNKFINILLKNKKIAVNFHTVLTNINLSELPDIINLINNYNKEWRIDVWHYYPDYNNDSEKKKYLELLPSYSEIIKTIRKNSSYIQKKVNFILFPYCVVRQLKEINKKFSFYKQSKYYLLLTFDGNFYFFKKIDSSKEFDRVKTKFCKKCKFNKFCFGIFKEYIEKYGEDEFKYYII